MNKKVVIVFFILLLVLSFSIYKIFGNSYAVSDNENEKLFSEVAKLERYAKEYISLNGSSLTSTELTFQYLRRNRYNDTKWNTLLGVIDNEFVTYVDSKGGIDIESHDSIIESKTFKNIDFIHLIAVLNCYYKYGDTVKLMGIYDVSSDYSGWAGDLLTYLEEITNYRINNSITEKNTLLDYSNSLLGTKRDSSFSSEDIYADLDAINLYKSNDLDLSNLSEALTKYYYTEESNFNYLNRVASSRNYIGTDAASIKTKALTMLKNSVVQNFLVNGLAAKVTDLDYEVVADSFVNYMLEKPYLEISSQRGTAVVGDPDIRVELIESNLGVPQIILSKDICDVDIINDIMYIKPILAGTTIITIKSANSLAEVTYELTSSNVAPSITKDLDEEYNFSSGVESNISFITGGTNNTYKWYLGNTKDGDFKEIGTTSTSSFNLKPKVEMNGKYLKCVISNEGNTSVTSRVALLNVKNISLGEIVNTGDITLEVAIAIIILVVSLNIGVYVIRRVKNI